MLYTATAAVQLSPQVSALDGMKATKRIRTYCLALKTVLVHGRVSVDEGAILVGAVLI